MKLAITQRRSAIGRAKGQKATIEALGFKRLYHQVEHNDNYPALADLQAPNSDLDQSPRRVFPNPPQSPTWQSVPRRKQVWRRRSGPRR